MRRVLVLLTLLACSLPLAARVRAVRSGSPADTPAAWLRARAVDDAGFIALTRDAQVVALGDATHGTHETYAAKQHLVPLLVANGFRTIAFEAPYAEWKKLDDYVLHGIGDPATALQFRLYWFWDANEILELVRWMRAQNEAGLNPPIRITGVDSTEPVSAASVVVEFLRRVDSDAALAAEESYACVPQVALGQQWCNVDDVRASLLAHRDDYAALTSLAEVDEMIHAARVVEQGLRVIATYHGARDEIMAENVHRLAARGDKIIILGHNEHWGQTPYRLVKPDLITSAGTLLSASLGSAYVAVGSVLLDGTFLAIDYEERYGQIRTQIMTAPSSDDVATLLDAAGLESMIVPLHGTLPSWLAGTRRMRIGTSGVQSRTKTMLDVPVDLGKKFDAVLYVRRSTPTQLRHWPVF
jgi:erythromycin esterase